jgi:hypothetical protein
MTINKVLDALKKGRARRKSPTSVTITYQTISYTKIIITANNISVFEIFFSHDHTNK